VKVSSQINKKLLVITECPKLSPNGFGKMLGNLLQDYNNTNCLIFFTNYDCIGYKDKQNIFLHLPLHKSRRYFFLMKIGLYPEWRGKYSTIWIKRKLNVFSPEIVYSLSYQEDTILYADYVSKILKIPHILHIADSPFKKDPSEKLKKAVNNAASCIAISNLMANDFKDIFNKKWEIVYNGSIVKKNNRTNKNKEELIVRYIGILHKRQHSNSIEDVIDAVDKNNQLNRVKIKLEIYGYENPKSWLSSKNKSENVIFKGPFDENKYERLILDTDILLLPITFNEDILESYRYSFPAKLSDYIASGKPILYYGPVETATNEELRQINSATLITKRDINLIVKSFVEIESVQISKNSKSPITKIQSERYSAKSQLRVFDSIMNNISK
jgi:hypothetical protein